MIYHDYPTGGVVKHCTIEQINAARESEGLPLLGLFSGDLPDLAEAVGLSPKEVQPLFDAINGEIPHYLSAKKIEDSFGGLRESREVIKTRIKAMRRAATGLPPLPLRARAWLGRIRANGETVAGLLAALDHSKQVSNSRRPEFPRRVFVAGIAHACRELNIRLYSTKTDSEDGSPLASVLKLAFLAAGEDPPADLSRLMRGAVRDLKNIQY